MNFEQPNLEVKKVEVEKEKIQDTSYVDFAEGKFGHESENKEDAVAEKQEEKEISTKHRDTTMKLMRDGISNALQLLDIKDTK